MGLSAQNVAIVPTPSGILDGHFPDGNDGSGAIPLTWASIPPFTQKQEGTPFSVDLVALYLTQAGSPNATITVTPGFALPPGGGWSLSSAGVLSYSGTGTGSANIRVRATRNTTTSDSNLFAISSIPVVSNDTIPPTIPTGMAVVSKTANSITVNSDVPSDVSTATITASGLREVRWFKGGVFDGVASYGAGLLQRLTQLDVADASGARKLRLGHYVAIAESDSNKAGGHIPNATQVWDTGPIASGTQAVTTRYDWKEIETGQGVYNLTRLRNELYDCSHSAANGGTGVLLFPIITVRTFDVCPVVAFTSARGGATTGTLTSAIPNGTYGFVFYNSSGTGSINNAVDARNAVTVTGGVNCSWSGALVSTVATAAFYNTYANNPLPTYLIPSTSPYPNGTGNNNGGWQGRRWDTSAGGFIARYTALLNYIASADAQDPKYPGVTFRDHPNFGGIATQETACSVVNATYDGYSQTAYNTGLKAESDAISAAFPKGRHLWLMNFMSGNQVAGTASLKDVAAYIWQNGAIVAGPDLVMAGAIVNPRCYPIYAAYHDGLCGALQKGAGYIACSIQNAEWTGIPPADGVHPMETLYQWGNGQIALSNDTPPVANPFVNHPLDIYIWDWHQGTNTLGENFANAVGKTTGTGGTMVNHPPPFGTLQVPAGGMTSGSVTQTNADYDVLSYGTGLSATSDQWTAANNSVNGDVTVICKFASLSGADLTNSPVMGLRISDASGTTARAVYMVATSTQLRSRYRVSPGAAVTSVVDTNGQGWNVPKWVKITRAGNLFSFFYANDVSAFTWTAVGTVTLAMQPTVYVQLFAATVGTSSVTGHFQQVNVQQLAKVNYTFNGLTTATQYALTAVGRDIANNDSDVSATLLVTTN